MHYASLPLLVITARKRSLGQGNIFAPVYHSVHRGGTWADTPVGRYTPLAGTPPTHTPPGHVRYTPWQVHPQAGTPPGQVHPPAGTPHQQVHPPGRNAGRYGQQAGGTHPTGMHSCLISAVLVDKHLNSTGLLEIR